jgi:hypothetical protein
VLGHGIKGQALSTEIQDLPIFGRGKWRRGALPGIASSSYHDQLSCHPFRLPGTSRSAAHDGYLGTGPQQPSSRCTALLSSARAEAHDATHVPEL